MKQHFAKKKKKEKSTWEEVSTKPKNWRKLTKVFCPNHGTYIRWQLNKGFSEWLI